MLVASARKSPYWNTGWVAERTLGHWVELEETLDPAELEGPIVPESGGTIGAVLLVGGESAADSIFGRVHDPSAPVIMVSSSSSCLCSATVSVKVLGTCHRHRRWSRRWSRRRRSGAGVVTSASIAAAVSTTAKCPFPEKRSLCSTVRTTSMPETT